MAIINVTIKESDISKVYGIPDNVIITTNIPASIFYTLDGTTPSIYSDLYTSSIELPVNATSVTLSVFATDGFISSSVIVRTYKPNIVFPRKQLATVLDYNEQTLNSQNIFPFGSPNIGVPVLYGNLAGEVVDDLGTSNYPDGYDGTATGTYANGTDKPLWEYDFRYSESDAQGRRGRGIGTVPADVTFIPRENPYPKEATNTNDVFFNPKASVIYQDSRLRDENTDILNMNRQMFSSEDNSIYRSGYRLFTSGDDKQSPMGTFIRQHYDADKKEMTYFYFDKTTLKWIISVEPFTPKENIGLFNIVFSPRAKGDRHVFKWYPFRGRRLI